MGGHVPDRDCGDLRCAVVSAWLAHPAVFRNLAQRVHPAARVVRVAGMPAAAASRGTYVVCAEVFALVVECLLFWWAFIRSLPRNTVATIRDCLAITAANAASFIAGALFWP